jgi:hypothetical protein
MVEGLSRLYGVGIEAVEMDRVVGVAADLDGQRT